ncbi:FecR family protein [Sphingomonas pokkalii]|uniref:FecR family protein n=1 Tax=Sphingomonas pokkalii TaxID=2175090 RepID=UPI001F0BE18D|nr:FecR domain-containing protein [Sphingomonas pokkalii]
MQADATDVIDTAIAWHLRLAEADARAWADFVAWLEASPAHAAAYDRVAAEDRLIAAAPFRSGEDARAGNDNVPAPAWRRWAGPLGGAAAAAAIAAICLPMLLPMRAAPYQVATRDGERRTLSLEDGTRIQLSGGTRLVLDRNDPRIATLEQGEALFHVRHDAARAFTVKVGEVAVQDLGTVFDVAHAGSRLNVAVAEGSVRFQSRGPAVTLKPGDALSARADGTSIVQTRIAPQQVGGWRDGTLGFDGQPMHEVAGALKRLYGLEIALEGSLSERPFTGLVRFSGQAERDVPHLAELIGASWRRDGKRWILSSETPATP